MSSKNLSSLYLCMTLLSFLFQSITSLGQNKKPDDVQDNGLEEIMPFPKGGFPELNRYIGKSMKYPFEALLKNISGKVFVTFIIDEEGKIGNVGVLKGIGGGCDGEAVRVVAAMPDWNPGTQGGKRVKVKYTMPINFSLSGGSYMPKPLFILDGEETTGKVKSDFLKSFKGFEQDTQLFLSPAEAIAKYGKKGKNEAVVISTKK